MTATVDAAAASRATGLSRAYNDRGNRQISQIPYLPGLDGIRAIAVVAVMVYHANNSWLAGGYLGVEVFFVISGYLITLLLIAEHERSGSIDLRNFWMRRARRLLPALFVMLLLLSVWVALFERDALGKLRGDAIAGIFYGSNWYQIWTGAGYSAGNDFAPLRHLWSLAVEEQFYLVWPLVMIGFVRFGSRRIAGIARWLFLAAVAVTVVVALLTHSGPQNGAEITPEANWIIAGRAISKPDALYLSTLTRSSGLLLGSAFAMVWRPNAIMRGPLRRRGAVFDLGALLGLVALALMAWKVSFTPSLGVDGFLFRGGLFATGIATLAVIAAVTHRGALTGKVLSLPIMLWIGTRSYGLYLYHWPIYQVIRNIAANRLRFHEFVLAMVATCIITELSYRYVEMPIRQGRFGEMFRRRRSRSRRQISDGQRGAVLVGAAAALGLSVFAVGSIATAELKQNDVQQSIEAGEQFNCDVLTENCDGDAPAATEGDDDFVEAVDEAATPVDEAATPVDVGSGPDSAAEPESTVDAGAVVPGTTEPPVEDLPPIDELALGDSVMLGAAQQLTERGFVVNAEQNRPWGAGVEFMRQLAEADRLPNTLVIHLGTNSRIGADAMNEMMDVVADVPVVLILTNKIPTFPDIEQANNAVIYEATNTYDNAYVLDWFGLSDLCTDPDCFASDDIHLGAPGRQLYAQLISERLAGL